MLNRLNTWHLSGGRAHLPAHVTLSPGEAWEDWEDQAGRRGLAERPDLRLPDDPTAVFAVRGRENVSLICFSAALEHHWDQFWLLSRDRGTYRTTCRSTQGKPRSCRWISVGAKTPHLHWWTSRKWTSRGSPPTSTSVFTWTINWVLGHFWSVILEKSGGQAASVPEIIRGWGDSASPVLGCSLGSRSCYRHFWEACPTPPGHPERWSAPSVKDCSTHAVQRRETTAPSCLLLHVRIHDKHI